jgi:hypothetical protein
LSNPAGFVLPPDTDDPTKGYVLIGGSRDGEHGTYRLPEDKVRAWKEAVEAGNGYTLAGGGVETREGWPDEWDLENPEPWRQQQFTWVDP